MVTAARAPLRVVIAEDSAVVRAGLAEILADRGHVVAAAVGDADALRAAVAEHRPDVTVVDVRMPPSHTDEGLRAPSRSAATIRAWGCWCSPSTSRPATRPSCSAPDRPAAVAARRASVTCSRTASPMSASSSRR